MNWILNPEEKILWQGRPAPRCYLFANIGLVLAMTSVMVLTGCVLWFSSIEIKSLPGLLLALLVISTCFCGPGRLLYRRWRWESLFYAVTTRRVLIRRVGSAHKSYLLSRLVAIKVTPYADRLASIELVFKNRSRVVLECLEQPQSCLAVLDVIVAQNLLARNEQL